MCMSGGYGGIFGTTITSVSNFGQVLGESDVCGFLQSNNAHMETPPGFPQYRVSPFKFFIKHPWLQNSIRLKPPSRYLLYWYILDYFEMQPNSVLNTTHEARPTRYSLFRSRAKLSPLDLASAADTRCLRSLRAVSQAALPHIGNVNGRSRTSEMTDQNASMADDITPADRREMSGGCSRSRRYAPPLSSGN